VRLVSVTCWVRVVLFLFAITGGFRIAVGQVKAREASDADRLDRGYLSPDAYTNASLGFKVGIPKGINFQPFAPKVGEGGETTILFGLQSNQGGLTVFMITSTPSGGGRSATEEVARGGKGKVEKKIIGGREFWESSHTERLSDLGKLSSAQYATELNGTVLSFLVTSFDSNAFDKLRQAIEAVQIFDPAKAEEIAGAASVAYPLNTAKPVGTTLEIKNLGAGSINGDIYSNQQLGLIFRIPSGWNHPDDDTQKQVMESGHRAMFGDDPAEDAEHQQSLRCTKNLVWLTKYPMGTKNGMSNPLVVLNVVDESCLGPRRFPSSPDDRDGLAAAAQQLKMGLVGSESPGTKESVRAFLVGDHLMVEVSGERLVSLPGRAEPEKVSMTLTLMEQKGFLLEWMYGAGSSEELAEISKLAVKLDGNAAKR
jgi:hypothetical protein